MLILNSTLNPLSNPSLPRVEGLQELLRADGADSLFPDSVEAVLLDEVVPDEVLDHREAEEVVRSLSTYVGCDVSREMHIFFVFVFILPFFRFFLSSCLFNVSRTRRPT